VICEKCKGRVFKHVSYRNSESGELIEYFSCCNCSTIVFPDNATETPIQPVRDFNLSRYCRENYADLDARRGKETCQQICDWIEEKYGYTFTPQSLSAAMCTAKGYQRQPSTKKPDVSDRIKADMPEILHLVSLRVPYTTICRMKGYDVLGSTVKYWVDKLKAA
jgi:hypothetical protein